MDKKIEGKLAVIGCGHIGSAIVRGLVASKKIEAENVICYDPKAENLEKLRNDLKVSIKEDASSSIREAKTVIIAVKPNVVIPLLLSLKSSFLKVKDQLLISVAAGVKTSLIRKVLHKKVKLARVMPNLPITIKMGAIGAFIENNEGALENIVKSIFEELGTLVILNKEEDLDAVTALSGSGPGYVFLILEALMQGGILSGLNEKDAKSLAIQTVLGSCSLLLESNEHPAVLRDRVSTPKGTTVSGLAALEMGGLRACIMNALVSASHRATEIGKELEGENS